MAISGWAKPTIEHVGSSGLSANSGDLSTTWRIKNAATHLEAEACACVYIPQFIPGQAIKGPPIVVGRDADGNEITDNYSGQELDADGNMFRCNWPDRYISGLKVTAGKEQRKGSWLAQVDYEGCVREGYELSFSTGGRTRHIKYATQIDKWPSTACDWGGAIDVRHDGSIQGCDVPAEVGRFSITKCYPPLWMNCRKYFDLVCKLGCVNSVRWGPDNGNGPDECFPAESLRFIGASGTMPRLGVQRITYEFEFAKPEEVSLGFLTNPETGAVTAHTQTVGSHDKWWVRGELAITTGCDWEVKLPEAIYVHQICGRCNYGQFFEAYDFPQVI